MTATVSPELERMAARCRLPIRVQAWPLFYVDEEVVNDDVWRIQSLSRLDTYAFDVYSATRAYVSLRAELEKA